MALSRRVEYSGGLRLSLSGTVFSWANFYDLLGAGSYLFLFLSFYIVSRPNAQNRWPLLWGHSGRFSICCISIEDSYLISGLHLATDNTVNHPVWRSNTGTPLESKMEDYFWKWSSPPICIEVRRYKGLSNNRFINQLIAHVRYLLVTPLVWSTSCTLVIR